MIRSTACLLCLLLVSNFNIVAFANPHSGNSQSQANVSENIILYIPTSGKALNSSNPVLCNANHYYKSERWNIKNIQNAIWGKKSNDQLGDLIISTKVTLTKNINKPFGKVIITGTGILVDQNNKSIQALEVIIQNGGVVITHNLKGIQGEHTLFGNSSITLEPRSTVSYEAKQGTQHVTSGIVYGNLLFGGSSKKMLNKGVITVLGDFELTSNIKIETMCGTTMVFSGEGDQKISGLPFEHVMFSNHGIKTLSSPASVNGNLSVSGTTILNTNNLLTLLSGPQGSAQIKAIPQGADIIGNVCWNQFIPGGQINHRWRMLSSPVHHVTFSEWQKDIFITGPGINGVACEWDSKSTISMKKNSNGFDQNNSGVNSCVTFSEPLGIWQSISHTDDEINPVTGYKVLIRGNRNIEGCMAMNSVPDSVSAVTIRSCGPIVKFDQIAHLTKTAGTGNGWNFISNPYPCTINWWDQSWVASRSAAIQPTIYVWLPEKNQYSVWNPFIGSVNGGSNMIPAGQPFFVQTSKNTNLEFKEKYKSLDENSPVLENFPIMANNNILKIALAGVQSNTNDEAIICMMQGTTSRFENPYDAYKMGYTNGSIASGTKQLSSKLVINSIAPVRVADTLPLFTNLSNENEKYVLQFNGTEKFDDHYVVFLFDKHLQKITNVELNNKYEFFTQIDNPSSYDQNRFELIIMNTLAMPVTLTELTASKQADGTVLLNWTSGTVNNSNFIIEKSNDGHSYEQIGAVAGSATSITEMKYSFTHVNPISGNNYYRLMHVDGNNKVSKSQAVTVNFREN